MVNRSLIIGLLVLVLAVLVWGTNTTTVIYAGNLNVPADAHQAGDLLVFSGNIAVAPGATFDGSLLVLCCNVNFAGVIAGDVGLDTGNLMIGSEAQVGGAVRTLATNVTIEPQAIVEGKRASFGFWPSFIWAVVVPPVLTVFGLVALGVGIMRGVRQQRTLSTQY
jgi:cytoskeletal protein CcmA (bactofilin family)